MRTLLVLLLLALSGAAVTAGTSAGAASGSCAGTVTEQVNGHTVRASSIATRNTGCRHGKRIIRRFLNKADRKPTCNRRSKQPPPTSGCHVGAYNCFRSGSTYCASPQSREVSWRE